MRWWKWKVFVLRTNAVTFLMSLTRKKDLDLDEVGVCDWSYSVLCSMQVGGGLTSLFPDLNANLSPIPLLCHFFFISFVRKSVLEFEILNLFFGLLEKYEARIKNQNFFTWMKVYNS